MARPRIFISSSHDDLKYVRSSLERFVSSLGFEAVLSEKGRIAYDPDIPLDESCYQEVIISNIFVLIIGERYGSEISATRRVPHHEFLDRYESITRKEYRSAVEKSIPTYTLVDRPVLAHYSTFINNNRDKTLRYGRIDSVGVFDLIEEILEQPKNNPLQPFDQYIEIEDWLRDQWAGLFCKLLQGRQSQAQIPALEAQLARQAEEIETLKASLERYVSMLAPQESEGILQEVTLRLEETQTVSLLRGNPSSAEVTVSYVRTDLALCTEVVKLIQRIGYGPYRDIDSLAGGQPWHAQLLEVLKQSSYVVVLCTRAAVESPGPLLEEIRLASENERTIIPIELDPGAMRTLFTMAGYEEPEQIQYIDAVDREVGDRLEDALRRVLTHRVRIWLEDRRAQARSWAYAERLNPDISFWEEAWRDCFPPADSHGLSGSVALTARGGSGKSTLIAHCVRHLLADTEIYPVLVEEATLGDARDLSRSLGARSTSELPRQVEALASQPPGQHPSWKPMRVVFIVDGLDEMATPGDVQQQQLVDGLNLLVSSAPVLITCRGEVWNSWYAGRVSVPEKPVEELDERRVRSLLQDTRLADQFNPLLQVPFFLDIALSSARAWPILPRTETGFLQQIWSDVLREGPVLLGDTGRPWILENLAACQLQQLAYEIPLTELCSLPAYEEDYEKGLRELKAAGLLVEQTRRSGQTVRLRHDLLDNYSMARVLLNAPDKLERCRELCRRCDEGCGWSLLATLVQAAHDWDDETLKRELFSEFLFILDHKKFGAEAMTRAWAVTHVLSACFIPLFRLILQALRGTPVGSLDRNDPEHVEQRPSRLGPPATLTQEALSTLASSFMSLRADQMADAEPAVPALAHGLRVWPLKGRLLEALGRFRTNEALDAILSFARQKLNDRDDVDVLLYVARNLQHFPQPAAAALLREIFADTTLPSRVRRVAAASLEHLRPGQVQVPPRGEDEIVDGLRIRGRDGRYSDWREVQEHADYVRRRAAEGDRFGPRVLAALIQALQHDQIFVRCSVVQALALFEGPAARDALLNEVLEPALPAEVRSACFEALKSQLRRLADPLARQAFRYLLLRAARAARHAGSTLVENGLLELALDPELRRREDWLLTPQAVEVLPPSGVPWSVRSSVTAVEVDLARELSEIGSEDVGPNREPKYLFAGLQSADGVLDVSLAPTTWKLGKSFHNAVRKHPYRFLRDGGRWLEPVPLGDTRLPGMAVVHGIILTSDGQLLASRRSARLGYAPQHWSLSFEEQITDQDVREGDRVFHLAARRGMAEEFGSDVDLSRIHLVSMLLEMDNLNLAAVVLIDAPQKLKEIHQRWSGEPRPSHAWEAQALDGIEADPVMLEELAGGAELRLEPLHPTSRMRCAMLARWLRRRASLSA